MKELVVPGSEVSDVDGDDPRLRWPYSVTVTPEIIPLKFGETAVFTIEIDPHPNNIYAVGDVIIRVQSPYITGEIEFRQPRPNEPEISDPNQALLSIDQHYPHSVLLAFTPDPARGVGTHELSLWVWQRFPLGSTVELPGPPVEPAPSCAVRIPIPQGSHNEEK